MANKRKMTVTKARKLLADALNSAAYLVEIDPKVGEGTQDLLETDHS